MKNAKEILQLIVFLKRKFPTDIFSRNAFFIFFLVFKIKMAHVKRLLSVGFI